MRRLEDGASTAAEPPEPYTPDLREPGQYQSGDDGIEFATRKVISRLTEFPLDELTQRQAEVDRRGRRRLAAVAGSLLLLAVAASMGAWAAWSKSRELMMRLGNAIAMAARQVDVAVSYRGRDGVPASVIRELIVSAQTDISALVDDAGETRRVRLERARLALRFSELYEIVGDSRQQANMLDQAQADIAALPSTQGSWWSRLLNAAESAAPIADDAVACKQLRHADARASLAVLENDFEGALAHAAHGQEVAKKCLVARIPGVARSCSVEPIPSC